MTASSIAGSIEAQARAIAEAMRAYASLNPRDRDDLVASIDLRIERLEDDWDRLVLKHRLETRKETP